ncbi:MAG: beta-lactamase family protein, partial [Chloroflexi bacterium]|nr:beta-lactamase family protein [Chloroflexota bacterium]
MNTTAASWPTKVQPIVEGLTRTQEAPGLVIAVAREEHPPEYLIAGADAAGQSLSADTLFPVASIVKLATVLTVLRLAAAGRLALDDLLAHHLPDAAAASEGVTLRTLLCHTSGLPLDLPAGAAPYTARLDWPALARACLATPLAMPPQTQVTYNNLGPGLLA